MPTSSSTPRCPPIPPRPAPARLLLQHHYSPLRQGWRRRGTTSFGLPPRLASSVHFPYTQAVFRILYWLLPKQSGVWGCVVPLTHVAAHAESRLGAEPTARPISFPNERMVDPPHDCGRLRMALSMLQVVGCGPSSCAFRAVGTHPHPVSLGRGENAAVATGDYLLAAVQLSSAPDCAANL